VSRRFNNDKSNAKNLMALSLIAGEKFPLKYNAKMVEVLNLFSTKVTIFSLWFKLNQI
jgi:hypothetical protein